MTKGADIEKSYALIIGISEYKDPGIRRLNYTHADAEGIFELLTDPKKLRLSEDNIRILLDKDATRFNINNAISSWLFKNADEDSWIFIFFAGHGGLEEDRLGLEKDNLAKYLLPYDTVLEDLFSSAISNRDFNDLLLTIRSKKLVIFMDSCYSGGVCKGGAKDVKIADDPYQKLAEGEGRIVIAASQPNQRSYEDSTIRHGVFTYNLIEALSGKADLDNDGYVSVIDAWKFLEYAVPRDAMKLAGENQEPILRGDIKKDFFISIDREQIEKKKNEKLFEEERGILQKFYDDGKLSGKQYNYLRGILNIDPVELKDKNKKIAKRIHDLLSGNISIQIFLEDMEGLEPGLFAPEPELSVLYLKGIEALATQDWQTAIKHFNELLSLDVGYRDADAKLKEARQKLELAQEKERQKLKEQEKAKALQEELKGLYTKGNRAINSKDYETAITALREVIKLDNQYQDAAKGKPLYYKQVLIGIGILGIFLLVYFMYSSQTTGSIEVSSTPSGASVYLDENYQGTTPMTIKNVRADSHIIKLKLKDYEDLSQTIRIAADKIAYVSKSLTPTLIPTPTPTPFTNSIGMEFVLIPAGEFNMGSPKNEKDRYDWEGPDHHVKISKSFYLGKYEVTQKQWRDIMRTDPSYFSGDKLPVEAVSWNEVQDFIKKLNEKEGANKYRLPTEAEWEYAARAGTTTRYFFGDDESKLGEYEWFYDNSGSKTHDVGQKKSNPWGLYDMPGNVLEWVQDKYHDWYYDGAPTDGSSWENGDGHDRVVRGGGWNETSRDCRSAVRGQRAPASDGGYQEVGFRLLRDL